MAKAISAKSRVTKYRKAVAKATLKTKKRAVYCAHPEPLEQEGSETRDDGEADNEHFRGQNDEKDRISTKQ